MSRLLVMMAVLFLAGCRSLEDPAPSQETRLVVHGVLNPTAFDQTVLVYRARTGLPTAVATSGFSDDEPVADAEVTMTRPDGLTLLADRRLNASGECCVAGLYSFETGPPSTPLKPGGTYTLRIRTPSGEEVSGTTTLPGPAAFTGEPRHFFFRARDTLRLNWPRVPGAASYEVVIRLSFDHEYRSFADTAFTLPGDALTIAGDEIFARGGEVIVLVSAVDANYYDYYRSQSDPFAGAAPSHLSGAVGVFGSIAPIYSTQLLVR